MHLTWFIHSSFQSSDLYTLTFRLRYIALIYICCIKKFLLMNLTFLKFRFSVLVYKSLLNFQFTSLINVSRFHAIYES